MFSILSFLSFRFQKEIKSLWSFYFKLLCFLKSIHSALVFVGMFFLGIDFIQLFFSLLNIFRGTVAVLWSWPFSKNVNLYLYMAVSLDIGYKLNISQTYVRSIHVLFPGEWERALHGHCNNMINVSKKRIGSISIVFLK